MPEPTVLYTSKDLAAVLGVGPTALSNWRRRGTGPLPEPQYVTTGGKPLYTRAQVEGVIAERVAAMRSAIE